MTEKINVVNNMCKSCARLGRDCDGTSNQTWTGCACKKPLRKMSELYKAHYSDGRTVYEKTLDEVYSIQGDRKVTVTPTIWLWKAEKSGVFFVDYVGGGISCTLETFSSLSAAEEYRDKVGEMDERAFEDWLVNVRWARKG